MSFSSNQKAMSIIFPICLVLFFQKKVTLYKESHKKPFWSKSDLSSATLTLFIPTLALLKENIFHNFKSI